MAKIFVVVFLLSLLFSESSLQKDLGPDVCQAIWNAAGSNLKVPLELKVDLTTGTKNVFTPEPAGKTKIASSQVFTTFKALLQGNIKANQDAFLNVITQAGGPVDQAMKYLNKQGILQQDRPTFIKTLWKMWFEPPPSPYPPTKQGFEHVFIGEKVKTKAYSGFHNWYQLYLEQSNGPNAISNVKYSSYTYNTEPSFMRLNFNWHGRKKKPDSSMFVGTSPAFDFAIYSLCSIVLFKTVPRLTDCTCKIHKSTVTIKAIEMNKQGPTQKILTAYPTSVVPDSVCTSILPTTRTDCGWLGIDHHNCAERGCCFDSQQYGGHIYWCFYPSDHKCHGIVPQKRKDCGFLGISRNECEGKGCCFDENFGQGVPHCFVGVPKG